TEALSMPTPNTVSEPSIIEIIQNMVREGETEEKILQTLNQLGVDPKKAQRLLLLAQADTFALLRSEISKIVKQNVDVEKQGMTIFVQQQAQGAVAAAKQSMIEDLRKDLGAYENQYAQSRRGFETQTNDTVQKFTDLAERIRIRVNEIG